MKNAYTKILIAVMFFQSHFVSQFALGQTVDDSNRRVQSQVEPNENCQPTLGLEQGEYGQSYDPAYQQCLARNRKKDELRGYMARGKEDAKEISVAKPVEPKNNCINTGGSGEPGSYDPAYQSCMSTYQAQVREYNRKIEAYNTVQQEQARAAALAQSEENKKLAKLNDTTATGSMAEIEDKNKKAQQLYTLAGTALAGYAAYKFAEGAGCTAQCGAMGGGCCAMAPALFAAGAAFMLLNAKANKQADEHGRAGDESCKAYNQLSSDQKNCDSGITHVAPPTPIDIYNPDGSCKEPVVPGCKPIAGGGPGASGPGVGKIPTNCVDKATGKSISCLTAGANAFKQNPDGSITVGGKTYSDKDFANKKAMMDAGLSSAAADQLMKDLYGPNNPLAKAGLDAKSLAASDQAKGDKNKFGEFGAGGGSMIGGTGSGLGGGGKYSDKGLGGSGGADRGLASEGLTRDFNGDQIGAAGDDIFTMMNRRYKLKAEQDAFINP